MTFAYDNCGVITTNQIPTSNSVLEHITNERAFMTCAYDNCGVIAINQIPTSNSVTGAYYRNFPQNVLCPKIYKLRPG